MLGLQSLIAGAKGSGDGVLQHVAVEQGLGELADCLLAAGPEAVLVVYDPAQVSYEQLLKVFWEGHDPTQGMRQGNDRGTQYRSAIYWTDDAQREAAEASAKTYGDALRAARRGSITTEIAPLRDFYYAEDYHQQYLAKVPNGYCGLGGTGVSCPVGTGTTLA